MYKNNTYTFLLTSVISVLLFFIINCESLPRNIEDINNNNNNANINSNNNNDNELVDVLENSNENLKHRSSRSSSSSSSSKSDSNSRTAKSLQFYLDPTSGAFVDNQEPFLLDFDEQLEAAISAAQVCKSIQNIIQIKYMYIILYYSLRPLAGVY